MRTRRILLVEHDDDGRSMYAEYLSLSGFDVTIASSSDDAHDQAPRADIVVTGIRVPGSFDGVELVKRLRETRPAKRLPIIVLTACGFEPDRLRAIAAGCDAFLLKPCLPEVLVGEICRLLSLRRVPLARPARLTARTRTVPCAR